ncbi:hypothetical protein [Parasphingorhabdus sp.]|jgi:hypothetical protein|uniref:hypothetical protein n=1 Tax=Parasphingorhabdus sp. TaxID=2709688 RepID=UPI00309B49AD
MISILTTILLSGALASADDVEIKELSADFYNLELARFEKKLPVLERHERQAERIAKKAGCKLPTDIGWVHARVDVALEVSPAGRVKKVIPIDTGCRQLEAYVIAHLTKYAGHDGAVKRSGDQKWYRQAITFRWPE